MNIPKMGGGPYVPRKQLGTDMHIPKMTTGMERIFRPVTPHGSNPMVYQEFILHYIHYMDKDGSKLKSKLDKSIPGGFYKEAADNEHSLYGEYTYQFPDGIKRRLVAIHVRR